MALNLADRVQDTTTTTSTGTITLSGTAPTGYQNFSVIGNGNTTYYTIAHQTLSEWEVGIGTYTSAGTTLSRTTVLASSNSGSLVVFSAGTKDVFVTYPAERSVNLSSAALTSGRVPYATTDGLLVDASTLTFNGTGMGIGSNPNTATKLNVAGSLTGATAGYGVLIQPTVQPDVTANVYLSRSQMATAANGGTPYTITNSYGYYTTQGTYNADSTVTNQYGFVAASALTGATNNYGFQGSITSGTGRYNLYMSGTADNYLVGTLGIGTTSLGGGYALRVTKTFSADNGSGVFSTANGSSSTPTGLYSFRSSVSTTTNSGTPYTIAGVYSYYATQGTFDADSTVTNNFGFLASSALTGATNNYAFTGQIASGTGRWNLYMTGTADNYMAGALGIGSTVLTARKLHISGTVTGATTAYGLLLTPTVQPDVTSAYISVNSQLSTAANGGTPYTIGSVYAYLAAQGTYNADSTITTQYGFGVSSAFTGATTNIGFYGNLASGTGRWNLYMSGTANNYLAGPLGIGSGKTAPAYTVDVNGTVAASSSVVTPSVTNAGTLALSATSTNIITASTNGSERMRIDSSGNLLIGTSTSPAGSKELVLGGDYIEAVVAIGTVTTTNTISLANGTLQTATLTASTACTFTMPTAIAGKSFTLLLKQAAATGNGTATFTSVKWGAAGAPTITATAGKMDILTFLSDGTNWYGNIAQGYTP
jgi:hypothetical protein